MNRFEPEDDYRVSHLDRGADYDAAIAGGAFDRYMMRHEAVIIDEVVGRLFPDGIPRYLDFACGTGRIAAQLEARARAAFAIDVSETMVAQARRKCARTRFLILDIARELPDIEPVDLVTAFRFFANAEEELREAVLASLRRIVRPGGYLLLNNHRNSWSVRDLLRRASGKPPAGRLGYLALRRTLARHRFRTVGTTGIGAWLLRSEFVRHELLDSRTARVLEPLSRVPLLGPVSPDNVVLCRRLP